MKTVAEIKERMNRSNTTPNRMFGNGNYAMPTRYITEQIVVLMEETDYGRVIGNIVNWDNERSNQSYEVMQITSNIVKVIRKSVNGDMLEETTLTDINLPFNVQFKKVNDGYAVMLSILEY